ncbi:hypothetical protein [Shewanella baltica]|uniref:hypothetical protein n=1 Tax=Shewanella baltica TaxID=62322 RepID=UPI0039B0727C
MKKSHLLSLLILLAGNSFANTEKMTYEKAMESDKNTFHRNSVPLQETIDNWNTYVKAPNESSGGSASLQRTYTQLWQSNTTSGITTGNIVLSESFRNFDEIVTLGSADNGGYVQHYRFTPAEYDFAIARGAGTATLYERDSVSWNGKFTTDTNWTTTGENAKLYSVYGVKFSSSPKTPSCSVGQTQTENVYCNSPQKTCEVGTRIKSCTTNGDWSPWSQGHPAICVSQTQQCP